MLTLALSLLVLAPQVGPDVAGKTVTLVAAPKRVGEVVEEMARQTGAPLAVSAGMQDELLIVHLDKASAETSLTKLAAVLSAKWTREGERWWLGPDDAARARLDREGFAKRRAWVVEKLQELEKDRDEAQIEESPDFEGGSIVMPEQQALPSGRMRLLARCLRVIGADAISAVGVDMRVVFASPHNRAQRPIPAQVVAWAAEELRTEWEHGAERRDTPPRTPTKVLVAVSRRGTRDSLTAELKVFDAEGRLVAEFTRGLSSRWSSDEPSASEEGATGGSDKKIEYGKVAIELHNLIGSVDGADQLDLVKVSPDLRAVLMRPDTIDPLTLVATDIFAALAKAEGMQVVANVPDSAAVTIQAFSDPPKTTGEALRWLRSIRDVSTTLEEGWLTVKPTGPFSERQPRFDRKRLARLLAVAQRQDGDMVDELAAFAAHHRMPDGDDGITLYLLFGVPGLFSLLSDEGTTWTGLQLYGLLNTAQRDALARGDRLAFGAMTPQQQKLLQAWVARPDFDLDFSPEKPKAESFEEEFAEGSLGSMLFEAIGQGAQEPNDVPDWRREPTELMPNGLPPDGLLELALQRRPVARLAGSGLMSVVMGSLSAPELGLLAAESADPTGFSRMFAPQLERLQLATRTEYTMTLRFAPDARCRARFQSLRVDPSAQVGPLTSLPSDFQADVAKWAQIARKLMEKRRSEFEPGEMTVPPR